MGKYKASLKIIATAALLIMPMGCAQAMREQRNAKIEAQYNREVEIKKTSNSARLARFDVPETTERTVNKTYDEYKKMTMYTGPNVAEDDRDDSLLIRAWRIDGLDQTLYQIVMSDQYDFSHWIFYDSAWDTSGNKLDVSLIDRRVMSCRNGYCTYNEIVGVNITREYLERHATSGIKMKVSGKIKDSVCFIPAGYVKGFLSAVK